jgi:hypothetical protein
MPIAEGGVCAQQVGCRLARRHAQQHHTMGGISAAVDADGVHTVHRGVGRFQHAVGGSQ